MRAVIYAIIWAIFTTIVCYYLYTKKNEASPVDKTELVEIINEVDGTTIVNPNETKNDNTGVNQASLEGLDSTNENVDSEENDSMSRSENSDTESLDERSESPIDSNNETDYDKDFVEKAYIEFNANSTKLPKSAKFDQYLDSVANIMLDDKYQIVLVGHADNSKGGAQNHYQVGLKRADFVKSLLASRNVNNKNILVISKGASSPRVDGDTPEAKTLNRRVELFIKQKN